MAFVTFNSGWCRGTEFHWYSEPGWSKLSSVWRQGWVGCKTGAEAPVHIAEGSPLIGNIGAELAKTAIQLAPVAASIALPPAAAPTLAFISASRAVPTTLEENPMAIGGAFNPLLQLAGIAGGAYLGGSLGQTVAGLTTSFLAPPPPTAIMGPVYGPQPSLPAPSLGIPTGGQIIPIGGAATSVFMQEVRLILMKIMQKFGWRAIPSLSRAIGIIRAAAKILAPAAIGAALGITTEELAQLIVAHQRRRRRRMNPCNPKALRRGLRRIRAFQRLANRVHLVGRSRVRRGKAYCPPGQPMIVQN